MAKPGDIPKSFKKQNEQIQEIKPYVEKVVDSYGYKRTKEKLEKEQFSVDISSGIIYIYLNENDSFNEKYKQVEEIISKEKYKGSWGVKFKKVEV